MRSSVILIVLGLSTSAAAQNELEIYPGERGLGTIAVRRGSFRAGQGSVFFDYPPSHFRGIGDDGNACALAGVHCLVQDQDRTTSESWTLSVRGGDGNGPTLGGAGVLFAAPVATPPNPGGMYGIVWDLRLTPATPVPVPCDDHFFVGHELPAAPGWPRTDGLAPWVYLYDQDQHLIGRPSHVWQFVGAPDTGTVSQPEAQVIHMGLLTPCSVLQAGTRADPVLFPQKISPDFGPVAMYPDVAKGPGRAQHGIVFRVRDAQNANGTAILLTGRFFDPSFSLTSFGAKGSLWITNGLDGQLTFGDPIDDRGQVLITRSWMQPGDLHRFRDTGLSPVQAITFTLSGTLMNINATNAVAVRY